MRRRATLLGGWILVAVCFTTFAGAQEGPGTNEFRIQERSGQGIGVPDFARTADGTTVAAWTLGTQVLARRFDSFGRPQAPAIRVDEQTFFDGFVQVEVDGSDRSVVTWFDGVEFRGRRFDAGGAALGAPFSIGPRLGNDDLLLMDEAGRFAFLTDDFGASQLMARFFDADGESLGDPVVIFEDNGFSWLAGDANAAGDAVVVTTDSTQSPVVLLLSLEGELRGEPIPFRPADANGVRPAVGIAADGSFVLAWREPGIGGDLDIFAQRFTAAGSPLGSQILVATVTQEDFLPFPLAAMTPAGEFLVAWNELSRPDGLGVRARLFGAAGNPLADAMPLSVRPELILEALTGGADGHFTVGFRDPGGLSGRTLRSDAPGGSLQLADSPAVPFSEVVEGVTLVPVHVRRAAGDGPVSVEFFTADPPAGLAAATPGEDYEAKSGLLIFGPGETDKQFPLRLFDDGRREGTESFTVGLRQPTGGAVIEKASVTVTLFDDELRRPGEGPTPQGPVISLGADLPGAIFQPSIATNRRGEFLVVWNHSSTAGKSLLGQLFDAGGQRLGSEVVISDQTLGRRADVEALPDGRFVVVWNDEGPANSYGPIQNLQLRRVAAASGPGDPTLEPTFQISECDGYPYGCQRLSGHGLAADGAGRLVVSSTQYDYLYGGYNFLQVNRSVRRFAPDGTPIDFQTALPSANDYATDLAVAADSGGRFLVVWQKRFDELTGRLFDAAGQEVFDADVPIATGLSGQNHEPQAVAPGAGGDFLVVGQQDALNDGVDPLIGLSGRQLLGRRLVAGGPEIEELELTDFRAYAQDSARLAASPSGEMTLVWRSDGVGGPAQSDVFAQRLDATGALLGEPIPIRPQRRAQTAPDVAMQSNGDFIVVWEQVGPGGGLEILAQRYAVSTCISGPTTLCLNEGRFALEVTWRDFAGQTGPGRAVPLVEDTGGFYFFDPDNVELVVKVLDGRDLNGFFWVFYGSLSNVEFDLVLRDTLTGQQKRFVNSSGQFASVGDTAALPGGAARTGPEPAVAKQFGPGTVLQLNDGRFQLEVEWQNFSANFGPGRAFPLTDDTGSFWFFDSNNLELVVKVLDGRNINNHFWVFYGSLSNVGFRLTVTDTVTGTTRTYVNSVGQFASVGDTMAFPAQP